MTWAIGRLAGATRFTTFCGVIASGAWTCGAGTLGAGAAGIAFAATFRTTSVAGAAAGALAAVDVAPVRAPRVWLTVAVAVPVTWRVRPETAPKRDGLAVAT
ncbi:hypothetical protein [Arthrobacter woluwensis]|uniref:hypothetical protein n=1 Tax=Arthrobacter woluwensis TaxID=156980 RepID=UPI001AAF972A|nr:hypothetical protein [Arthrobacter woluwensis]QTF70569.1 hypothetical protein G8758_11855 [Arthrobacter woluwensis]